ncbi:hypothetical protein V2J09_010122 [Rumex salicifolius]
MKGIRVRVLKRFKSLQNFHSFKDHITIYDSFETPQNPPSYKQHEHTTREEEQKATRKGHNEANSKLAVKDLISHYHYDTSNNNEDLFQGFDEDSFHDESSQMEKNGDCEGLKSFDPKCPPGGSNSVILYTTSLRGIRKTFDDCHTIKLLLDSIKVVYIERDVSMHLEFREELWEILGGRRVIPPRLFIKGGHIGGANEVVMLNECGELKSLLEGIALVHCNQECKGCVAMEAGRYFTDQIAIVKSHKFKCRNNQRQIQDFIPLGTKFEF